MSTLTSSAVGSSKAKPRAPPRRRAALPTAAPTIATSLESSTDHIVAAPELQNTEEPLISVEDQTAPRSPSPPPVVERDIPTHTTQSRVERPSLTTDDAISEVNPEERHEVISSSAAEVRDAASIQSGAEETRKRARTEDVETTANKRTRTEDEISTAEQAVSPANPPQETRQAISESTEDVAPVASAARPRRASRRAATQESSAQSLSTTSIRPARKRKTTAKASTAAQADNDTADVASATTAKPKPRRTTRKTGSKKSNGAASVEPQPTAEEQASDNDNDLDPEKHQIDPQSLSMYDLSHDTIHGKVSEREKKMAQIDWVAVAQKRRAEADAIMRGDIPKDKGTPEAVQSTENNDGIADDGEQGEREESAQPVTRGNGGGVRFRIVAGQIVEDESSLTIDRAARLAEAAAASAEEPVEEENDLTIRFNRTTYINARKRDETERLPLWRAKSDAWSEDQTDRFYDALSMFGTDFFIISKMFHPKTRRQIKLKFVREERLEPDRINAALLGKKTGKIDLDHYAQAINRDVNDFHKYDSLEHANQVIKASMKDKEEAMRAAVKEDDENNRQREVQRQQREKHRVEAEKKKEERSRKKSARRRGDVWGTGTLGGAEDDVNGGD